MIVALAFQADKDDDQACERGLRAALGLSSDHSVAIIVLDPGDAEKYKTHREALAALIGEETLSILEQKEEGTSEHWTTELHHQLSAHGRAGTGPGDGTAGR